MEDSSTNPFIPRESQEIRKKVYERQSPLGRVVKWALIITGAAVVLIGIALFFVVPRTTAVDQSGRQKLADALQPPDQTLKRVSVSSEAGFSLSYDNHVYDSYAEVGDATAGTNDSTAVLEGQTYENNDLRTPRAYNYVRIRPSESTSTSQSLVPVPPQLEIFATVSSKDLAAAAAIPENKGLSPLSLLVKLDGDKRMAARVADDGTVVTIDETKPVAITIGDVEYQKVRYTTTNPNYRITDAKYDDCYYTIQNNQPYSICVSGVRPNMVSAASLVEEVFNSITFQQPTSTGSGSSSTANANATSATVLSPYKYPLAILTQASTDDSTNASDNAVDSNDGNNTESALLTVTPDYYSDNAGLTSIAKTQPSVVRVGTLYCADLSLKYESGDTASTITDACVGNVANGVLVSKDGYIATTGHAIRNQKQAAIGGYINFAPDQNTMMDRLQSVLTYLLNSKIILQSDADYLTTGAQIGDQEALAKIENIGSLIPDNFIVPTNESYSYAVQPADKPIVIDTTDATKPAFAYSDSVVQAKYVASDYDPSKSLQYDFNDPTPSVDVGLLKISGTNFPAIPIAQQQTVKSNDTLNTLGYPAYADSSLSIDKIRNQPIVTTSKVDQVYKQDDGSQLIQTDTPVLPGNDGSPVVDKTGNLVGLAVYGLSYCPDQNCFANGTVRPIGELLKLLDENNISLNTTSQSASTWFGGVDQYMRSNYSAAAGAFASSASLYGFNVWASPLQKLAQSLEGTSKDTSLMNQLESVMVALLVILIVVTLILLILFLLHRRQINRAQVGHYGAAAPVVAPVGMTPTFPVNPQPYNQFPQLPPQDSPSMTPLPQAPVSESPNLPIRAQPAPQPQQTEPELPKIEPPTSRISIRIDEPDKKSDDDSGHSFYS